MSNSSILGGTQAPTQPEGTDIDLLGPSDSSDSGSDIQGEQSMATEADNAAEWGAIPAHADSQSDAFGTGERSSAAGRSPRDGNDILPDRIIGGDDEATSVIDDDVQAALDGLADDLGGDGSGEVDRRSDSDPADDRRQGKPGHAAKPR